MKKILFLIFFLSSIVGYTQNNWVINTDSIHISVWENAWGNYHYSLQVGEVSTSTAIQNVIASSTQKEDLYYPAVRYIVANYPVLYHQEEIYYFDMENLEIFTGDGDHYVFREYRDLVWFMVHEVYPVAREILNTPVRTGVFQRKH